MRLLVIGFAVCGAVILYFIKMVIDREYWWIAHWVGGLVIRCAGPLHPRSGREERVNEWLAELDAAAAAREAAVAYAVGTLIAASSARIQQVSQKARRTALLPAGVRKRIRSIKFALPKRSRRFTRNHDRFIGGTGEGWTVNKTTGFKYALWRRTERPGEIFRFHRRATTQRVLHMTFLFLLQILVAALLELAWTRVVN